MAKSRMWIIGVIIGAVIISLAIIIFKSQQTLENKTAKIYQNGGLIKEIGIDTLMGPVEFEITDDSGHTNRIRAERGKIRMSGADCPDQLCVKQGWIDSGIIPVVCLPNKVTIEITGGESDVDIQTGRS